PDDLLPTIRSRCQRIDFDPIADAVVQAALEHDGIAPDEAATLAALSGGQVARARALAGRLGPLRGAFASAPARVDGYGASALAIAQELDAAIESGAVEVDGQHKEELEAFDAEMERLGYERREAQRMRRRIEERHKRETRRTRIDLLIEGVTAIESVYRDALAAPAPPLNTDMAAPHVPPRAAAAALAACREARHACPVDENAVL